MHFPVDLHTHTVASTHAYSTLLEYVAQAKKCGVQLFATTDHGPSTADSPHPWHFSNLGIIPRIIDGVGILRGIEANILNKQGEIDCDEKMRRSLDIILAGLHAPDIVAGDKLANTHALINTIESGLVDIITHPGNPRFPIEIAPVVHAAKAHNVALEINNSSLVHSRIGSAPNCLAIAECILDEGGMIALGSDSHFASYLGGFDHAWAMLSSIDFPADRIINRSVRAVLDFLEARGHNPVVELSPLK
ncbi:phosphatase [Spirabiliibacterium falconis]|uniref:phosphatase n=1 Tax=Spirabiliibacterium falconis TaxID=572023 RepID=UPI001AAD507F|nr:phosphatase [Spirabiliibacterium falconis]MBE2895108.1 phosphatase [Spirabiliibacterium falconis]